MRYLPHTDADVQHMLGAIGVKSFDDLISAIPKSLRGMELKEITRLSEPDLLRQYTEWSSGRSVRASFVGAGLYRHFIPAAVDSLISRGEFFTAYTPYQPEASQGTLQAIFEFQTVVSELLGLEVANASMYDGASSAAEAVLMCQRLLPQRRRVLLAGSLHPDYEAVIRTYTGSVGVVLDTVPLREGRVDAAALDKMLGEDVAALVVQSPNCLGLIESVSAHAQSVARAGAKLVVAVTEPTSLGLLRSPGACGADVAVGEGTGIGLMPSLGGPGVGLFATKLDYLRQMPGRLAGQARDADGRVGYVLTLSTREQHIRRERATSNICTNHGLCALAFVIHAGLLGPQGLKQVAEQSARRARYLRAKLEEGGVRCRFGGPYYNEFVVELGSRVQAAIDLGVERGLAVGFDLARWRESWAGGLLLFTNELHTRQLLDEVADVLSEVMA